MVRYALRLILAIAAWIGGVCDEISGSNRPTRRVPIDKLKNLEFREIGPATMGGGSMIFCSRGEQPQHRLCGDCVRRCLKTTNNGTTWEPVFDKESVSTIGDNSDCRRQNRPLCGLAQASRITARARRGAMGCTKSLDGGKTWKKMGLEATRHIGRICGPSEEFSSRVRGGAGAFMGTEPGARRLQDTAMAARAGRKC